MNAPRSTALPLIESLGVTLCLSLAAAPAHAVFSQNLFNLDGTGVAVTSDTLKQFDPAVAYNTDNDQYLIAWSNFDDEPNGIYVQLRTSTGLTVPGTLQRISASPDPEYKDRYPFALWNPYADEYIVGWIRQFEVPEGLVPASRGEPKFNEIRVRRLDSSGTPLQHEVQVNTLAADTGGLFTRQAVRITAAPILRGIPGSIYIITWRQAGAVIARAFGSDGDLFPGFTTLSESGTESWDMFYNQLTDSYMMVYTFGGRLRSRHLDRALSTISIIELLDNPSLTSASRAALALNTLCQRYLVVFLDNRDEPGEVWGQLLSYDNTRVLSNFAIYDDAVPVPWGTWRAAERPRVASKAGIGRHFGVAWNTEIGPPLDTRMAVAFSAVGGSGGPNVGVPSLLTGGTGQAGQTSDTNRCDLAYSSYRNQYLVAYNDETDISFNRFVGDLCTQSGCQSFCTSGCNNLIPFLTNGNPCQTFNVLLLPDIDTYPAGNDQTAIFYDDIGAILTQNLYRNTHYFLNRDKINWWTLPNRADALPFKGQSSCGCAHGAPSGFANYTALYAEYPFLDAVGIGHGSGYSRAGTDNNSGNPVNCTADCSSGGRFSFPSNSLTSNTPLHELTHGFLGRADEYPGSGPTCGGNGGRFSRCPFPNLVCTTALCNEFRMDLDIDEPCVQVCDSHAACPSPPFGNGSWHRICASFAEDGVGCVMQSRQDSNNPVQLGVMCSLRADYRFGLLPDPPRGADMGLAPLGGAGADNQKVLVVQFAQGPAGPFINDLKIPYGCPNKTTLGNVDCPTPNLWSFELQLGGGRGLVEFHTFPDPMTQEDLDEPANYDLDQGHDDIVLTLPYSRTATTLSVFDGDGMPIDEIDLNDLLADLCLTGGAGDIDCAFVQNCCGDFDGNGTVNLLDFNTFATCFGPTRPDFCSISAYACADLDADGLVSLIDFTSFATLFGTSPAGGVNCFSRPTE